MAGVSGGTILCVYGKIKRHFRRPAHKLTIADLVGLNDRFASRKLPIRFPKAPIIFLGWERLFPWCVEFLGKN